MISSAALGIINLLTAIAFTASEINQPSVGRAVAATLVSFVAGCWLTLAMSQWKEEEQS